jgi:hypothetical protein
MPRGNPSAIGRFCRHMARLCATAIGSDKAPVVTLWSGTMRSPACRTSRRKSFAIGQQFGREIAAELHASVIEELRKRGHTIGDPATAH